MIALIMVPGLSEGLHAFNARYPTGMVTILDRPFLQHVVESLVEEGFRRFEVVLCHLPEKIEAFLGDGSRWGVVFHYHLARDATCPYEVLRPLKGTFGEEPILLAQGDRLPWLDLRSRGEAPRPACFCVKDTRGDPLWTGWALLPQKTFLDLPTDLDERGLGRHLMETCRETGEVVGVERMLDVRTYEGILDTCGALLEKRFKGPLLSAKEVEPGVWISRNVSLHPTAEVIPPVYVGENCQVGRSVRLGPRAALGKDCIVGSQSHVRDAVVFPGSYVGEALELDRVLVDRNRLVNVRVGAEVSISEPFILGGISGGQGGQGVRVLLSQCLAAGLLLLLWPLLLCTMAFLKIFRRGKVCHSRLVVRLPAPEEDALWRTFRQWRFSRAWEGKPGIEGEPTGLRDFFLRFLPGLFAVLKGDMAFVGICPRTREELLGLEGDWRDICLHGRAGLITEAYVQYGAEPSEDERFTAEAYSGAVRGFRHTWGLVFGYVERLFGREARNAHEVS